MYPVFRADKLRGQDVETLKKEVKDIFDGVMEAIEEGRFVEMFEDVVSQKKEGFRKGQIWERYEMKLCVDLPARRKRQR